MATRNRTCVVESNLETLDNVADLQDQRDVGGLATWSLSSFKTGSGVAQLRDDDLDTFWQSDGVQPHLVNIQFPKRILITFIAIYADVRQDESYTPSRFLIRAGNNYHDLQDVLEVDLDEPTGWHVIQVKDSFDRPVRAHLVQIGILANHQSGRDSHVRQLKIFSARANLMSADEPPFTSNEFEIHSTLR